MPEKRAKVVPEEPIPTEEEIRAAGVLDLMRMSAKRNSRKATPSNTPAPTDFRRWARQQASDLWPSRRRELLGRVGAEAAADRPQRRFADEAERIIDEAAKLGIIGVVERPAGPITYARLWDIIERLGKVSRRRHRRRHDVLSPTARLRVSSAGDVATLDGEPYHVTVGAGACLNLLLVARGLWVASREMKIDPKSGERPGKIINAMPEPIRDIIESRTGAGYRLTIFDPPRDNE